jgi:SAM-dependent methyltransferase
MKWSDYRDRVTSSREVMIFPFFKRVLAGIDGIGIDIGCGDGELATELAEVSTAKIVGVDLDSNHVTKAGLGNPSNRHFFSGDVAKNTISMTGIDFDFAVSNCCFSHLSDDDVYHVFVDLHTSLRDNGTFVFVVPHWLWAKEMYGSVDAIANGVMAVPRFGGRQSFRMPEWYRTTLSRCGFEISEDVDIEIPDDDNLDERYRARAGKKLFSAFVAKKRKAGDRGGDRSARAFDVAHANRLFEIELFWKRSLFYWGFIATATVGYGTTRGSSSDLAFLIALFGLVCSFVWAAGNRGSKYWQEYWEKKVTDLQYEVAGNIFFDRCPRKYPLREQFAPRRISVSKLTIALSDFVVMMWILVVARDVLEWFLHIPTIYNGYAYAGLLGLTAIYVAYFLRMSHSED